MQFYKNVTFELLFIILFFLISGMGSFVAFQTWLGHVLSYCLRFCGTHYPKSQAIAPGLESRINSKAFWNIGCNVFSSPFFLRFGPQFSSRGLCSNNPAASIRSHRSSKSRSEYQADPSQSPKCHWYCWKNYLYWQGIHILFFHFQSILETIHLCIVLL